jgi:hypothetical protein
MTAGERRGRCQFLFLATLIVVVKAGGILLGLVDHGAPDNSLIALVLVLSVPFLWRGTIWLQYPVGLIGALSGTLTLFQCVRSLEDFDVLGTAIVFGGILGALDILAGLAFWFLPDLNTFFRHRRAGHPKGRSDRDQTDPILSSRRRVKAACGWGLALGCGSGILLAAEWLRSTGFGLDLEEVVMGFLVGAWAGGLIGVVAGLAAGAAGPGVGLSTIRLAVTRGLIAAVACVITAVVGAAIYGGLFGRQSAFWGNSPGWPTAALAALLWTMYAGPLLAAAGFVHGVAIALLVRDDPE